MQMRNWLQCPSSLTHGNIIKRGIFSKKDPGNLDKDGAILNHIDSFSRCYLKPRIASIPTAFDDRQLVFYIVHGEGVFEAGDLKREVSEGDSMIVPPGLTHVLIPVPDLKATNSFSRISDSGDLLRISSRLIQIWYDKRSRCPVRTSHAGGDNS